MKINPPKEKMIKINTQEDDGSDEEEIIDTSFKPKIQNKLKTNVSSTINKTKPKQTESIDQMSDKKIDELLQNAKISANIVEYNEYGLKKKDLNPEILEYVTKKEFQPGVDIFIPAPGYENIQYENQYDIDIKPEDMNEEYKEVFEALGSDKDEGEELEDDFVMLANEGQLPIELLNNAPINNSKNEMVLAKTRTKEEPAFKYITKEEKEFLDKQFKDTYKEYSEAPKDTSTKLKTVSQATFDDAINEILGTKPKVSNDSKKKKIMGLTSKYDDEEEFEDYEIDDDNEKEDFEDYDEEEYEEEDEVDDQTQKKMLEKFSHHDHEDEGYSFNPGTIKIEYMGKMGENSGGKKDKSEKPPKKGSGPEKVVYKEQNGDFTVNDLNKLLHHDNFISKTVQMLEKGEEANKNKEKEDSDAEGIPTFYAKRKLDITSVHGKIGENMPKTVGEESKRPVRDITKSYIHQDKENEQIAVKINAAKNISSIENSESKEEKKLRKKLIKEETRERRVQKKELKLAFVSEKCKQQKQIAGTNKFIRYGISIKDA